MNIFLRFSFIVLLVIPFSAKGQLQHGNYVYSNGGGNVSGDTYQIRNAVIGETPIGQASSDRFSLEAGFVPALIPQRDDPRVIGVPEDYENIQDAINVASDGDTIRVSSEGSPYVENIDYSGKDIVIIGDPEHPDNVVIDGSENGSVVIFENGESEEAILTGFTIQNGRSNFGGGISCVNSDPLISWCIFINNVASRPEDGFGFGGGAWFNNSTAEIHNCVFHDNSAGDSGGGVAVRANVLISECSFYNNHCGMDGGGITFNTDEANEAIAFKCVIYNNLANNPSDRGVGGGGIALNSTNSQIINCTIVNNHSEAEGRGGISIVAATPRISNSIVWGNNGSLNDRRGDGEFTVNFSDIEGAFEGDGNINEDPLFINPEERNFHLQANSPCINTGDPNSNPDPDGTRADMGAYYCNQIDERQVVYRETIGRTPYEIVISGDYGFVADGESGLVVYNISDPTNPSGAGSHNLGQPGGSYGLDVVGDYAYMADGNRGLRIMDI